MADELKGVNLTQMFALEAVPEEDRKQWEEYFDKYHELYEKQLKEDDPAALTKIEADINNLRDESPLPAEKKDSIEQRTKEVTVYSRKTGTDSEKYAEARKKYAIAEMSVDLAKLGIAMHQISQGEKGLAALQPVTPPVPPNLPILRPDPALQRALSQAEGNVYRGDPIQERIAQQQQVGLTSAAAAAGQQSGVAGFNTLAQQANLQGAGLRLQAAQSSADRRVQNQMLRNQLLQQRQGENQAILASQQQATRFPFAAQQRAFYQYQYPEYKYQRGAAAQLGQAGRRNLVGTMEEIPTDVYNLSL